MLSAYFRQQATTLTFACILYLPVYGSYAQGVPTNIYIYPTVTSYKAFVRLSTAHARRQQGSWQQLDIELLPDDVVLYRLFSLIHVQATARARPGVTYSDAILPPSPFLAECLHHLSGPATSVNACQTDPSPAALDTLHTLLLYALHTLHTLHSTLLLYAW